MIRHVLIASSALLVNATGFAATFVVDSIFDTGDTNPGDNVCEATTGGVQCTLRAAIEEANARSGFDAIEFSVGLVSINISGTPLPTITDHIRIDGRTAPNYDAGATDVTDAPPSVYINGAGLGGTTADGFRAFTNDNLQVNIYAIGIIDFPDNGIELNGVDACVIDRNWVGTGRSAAIAGNGGAGVYMNDTDGCVVGQDPGEVEPGIGNLLSNNGEDGVYLILGESNLVAGNYIGLDPGGTSLHGNGRHGVYTLAPNNRIGGFEAGDAAGNEIGYNAGDGIRAQVGGQLIYGNFVYENAAAGIVLNGSGSNVGFTAEGTRNIVFDNGTDGVVIGSDFSSSSNRVQHSWIFSHPGMGIRVVNGGSNLLTQNDIWDNASTAIALNSSSNTVSFNEIGFLDGSLVGNAGDGVALNGSGNVIQGNDIGGMADDGVDVISGDGSQILDNRIGTGATGQDFGNTNMGIRVRAAATNLLIEDNRIGHNLFGIQLDGGGTRVCGNHVGLADDLEAAGNAEGLVLFGGGNVIGDAASGCSGNLIGSNGSDGIEIRSAANVVRNNGIGGRFFQQLAEPFGNGAGGILLWEGAGLNTIAENVIMSNGLAGVRIGLPAGVQNRIEMNRFRFNSRTAIDLLDNDITPNDPGDIDSGPNNLQNTPDLQVLLNFQSTVRVTYAVDSDLDRASYPLNVDFYYSAVNHRSGDFVVRDTYGVAPNTSKQIEFPPPAEDGYIMGMVVDADGNSSELSFPVAFQLTEPPDDEITADGFEGGAAAE